MPSDTPCGPKFAGYPIATSISQLQKSLERFKDLNILASTFSDSVPPVCNEAVKKSIFQMRYQVAMQCSVLVQEALNQGCNPPVLVRPQLICSKECNVAFQSFRAVLSDREICSNGDILISGTNSTGQRMDQFCQISKSNDCIEGTADEIVNCGTDFVLFRVYE
jgi:hypothetical protein